MHKIGTFLLFFISIAVVAQQPQKLNSAEIYNQIQKLNFLGSVLYVAAHPDDENTRLISYLSNEKKARTAYLSLTRGDGGQNLIGSELRELLGVIRTQELIEARKIDGGEQFFSRANDFGYSKTPDETLQIWDKNQVLSDVIWAIRKFQPDVIINRFDHRTSGTTHGHHTASAILGIEAFDKANDATVFPEQLQLASVWQPKRIFFNTSWWFYGSKEKFEKADKSNLNQFQLGVYYNNLGKSNQEIAALSRSRHQSQGFGSTGTRGEESEYLEFLKGDPTNDKTNIFDGIDTSWNRVKGGKAIFDLMTSVEKNFDFKNPSASVQDLVKAYQLIDKLEDAHWKLVKLSEIKKIIAACSGLYLEAVSETQEVNPGSVVKAKLEAINRSNVNMSLISLSSNPAGWSYEIARELVNNKLVTDNAEIRIPLDFEFTNPYWLSKQGTDGMYRVDDQNKIGIPDVIRQIKVIFYVAIEGVTIPFECNVVYKYTDDVKGEVYQPLDVVPQVSSSFTEKVYIFNSNKTKSISLKIKAGKDLLQGKVKLEVPDSWKVSPTEMNIKLDRKGEEQLLIFVRSLMLGGLTLSQLISMQGNGNIA